ncbi:MAG: hypothetical protein J6W76_04240, partial [Spirochaetales bacterium]|nr:hypothetical protein [Spirochaetales bacterium]
IHSLDGSEPISKVRESAGKTEGLDLLAGGKTAVIRFDSFFNYLDEWETYYDSSPDAEPNPESVTIPDDTCGFIYKSFYTLLNDDAYKNVKNVIVDVSCNGGGVTNGVEYFIANIIGSYYEYRANVRTGTQNIIYHNGADLNLDGKIDEEDQKYGKKIRDKFKFAVLTSYESFSCGNELPCICAISGIPIIGERSGGGSCAVGVAATADGLPYWYSQADRVSSSDGTSFEFGAPIDVPISSYADFYDDAKLQAVMDTLFPE